MLSLTIPVAPATGFTVSGEGFAPDSWIWITLDDLTSGAQVVNGPEAFQPDPGGSFTRTDSSTLPPGHTFRANAFVGDEVVATSEPVTKRSAPEPPPGEVGTVADADATAATKATYRDLVAAPERVDNRLVIGQALRGWDFEVPVAQPVSALTDAGLPAPKLIEVDLTDFGVTAEHDKELHMLLRDHADVGGLIGLSWHVGNPFTGGNVNDRNGVDLPQLADPTAPRTPAGTQWKAELDRIADILQTFADMDAVVVFRPLHESNGDWFWWGQKDPAEFATTWEGMFRYLTTSRGLHNLLWAYSANRNLGGEVFDPTRVYPGDAVVDIVGLDIYDDDLSDAGPGEPGYAALVALGKPFAITEYGAANWPTNHDGAIHLPNNRVIALIKQRYPRCVLATAWYSSDGNNWQISDKPAPKELLLDPWAITR